MDNDSQNTADSIESPEEERQDRRQFFNGLGKWSLAIIAAVSSLAGYGTRAGASREETQKSQPQPQRPAWTVEDDRNRPAKMAGYFKARKPWHRHVDSPGHTDWTGPKPQ